MSVEQKIKDLLGKKEQMTEAANGDTGTVMQGSSEKASFDTMPGIAKAGVMASQKQSKDSSKAAAVQQAGDSTQPMQGSSEKATMDEMDEDETNIGAKSASKVSKDSTLPTSKGDAKSVKTQAMEETESQEEVIQEIDIKGELNSIFGEDLSEEFKAKATSIFEAAVIARVNSEMENIVEKLEEQNASQLQEYRETMVEKVDSYLNYVVDQWMQENQIAIDNGLRNEITEEFITGLKGLFKEHYIEVPEEKYDVLEELTSKIDSLETKLDESISDNIELTKQFVELRKQVVFSEEVDGLASTEAEKLKKLIEGVEYESDELYREKITVIKENYFPKESKPAQQTLIEETGTESSIEDDGGIMSKYVQAISRTVKSR